MPSNPRRERFLAAEKKRLERNKVIRECVACGARLSRYNPADTCWGEVLRTHRD